MVGIGRVERDGADGPRGGLSPTLAHLVGVSLSGQCEDGAHEMMRCAVLLRVCARVHDGRVCLRFDGVQPSDASERDRQIARGVRCWGTCRSCLSVSPVCAQHASCLRVAPFGHQTSSLVSNCHVTLENGGLEAVFRDRAAKRTDRGLWRVERICPIKGQDRSRCGVEGATVGVLSVIAC